MKRAISRSPEKCILRFSKIKNIEFEYLSLKTLEKFITMEVGTNEIGGR
jgi:hypothetical protein